MSLEYCGHQSTNGLCAGGNTVAAAISYSDREFVQGPYFCWSAKDYKHIRVGETCVKDTGSGLRVRNEGNDGNSSTKKANSLP